jgi:uncharacterized protein YjgD (DUF1641 family)
MSQDLIEINQKLDTLMAHMAEEQKRQQAMNELRDDMLPIANHMIKLTIDELAEIGTEFRGEDLLFLVKRLLRNTHLLIKLVDQLEGLMGIADEVDLLGKQVFNQAVMQLDSLEQRGYFSLAREGMQVVDQVVGELAPEDVHALGDVIVKSIQAAKEPTPEKAPSMLALARQMNDPQVRTGMARMLNVVKAIS